MKMKYIFWISFLLGSICMNSCKDFLDQKPVSELTLSNAYESEADVKAGLQGVYNRLEFAFGESSTSYYSTSLLSDESASRIADWGDLRAGSTYWGVAPFTGCVDCYKGTLSPNDGITNWQVFYVPINMINTLLKVSDKISFSSAEDKKVLQGELYFLRALCYFNMLRIWGKVPIIDVAYTSAGQNFFPKQSSLDEVATFIAKDIDKAAPLLSEAPFSRVRATEGALNAFKAHFYAWKGRVLDGGNTDLQTAADAALSVIDDDHYKLLSNYSDIFYKGYESDESIFELLTIPGKLTSNLFTWAKEPIKPNRPRGLTEFSSADLAYFANNPEDKRIDVLKNEPRPGDLIQEPYVSKWLGSNAGGIPTDEADNIILFRLADIILLRAEMLNELGQTGQAVTLLNQIRDRAGVPHTTAATNDEVSEAIFNERHIELMAEGYLWFDIVRFGKAMNLPEIDSPDEIYFPVYQGELDANPNLVQNPFYK